MLTTGCPCGAVHFGVAAISGRNDVFLCTICRAQSSPAFAISGIVSSAAVLLSRDQLRLWSPRTQTGKTLARADCGRRIGHLNIPHSPEMSINGRARNPYVDLTAAAHISTVSELPCVAASPDAPQFPQDHP